MYCRRCGRENRENARFCVGCGSSLTDGSAVREMAEVPGKRRKAKKKRKGKIRKFLIITLIIMAAAAIFTAFWFLYRQDRWKEVYISYIESEYRVNGLDEDAVYFLINVDGDEIPELYIYYENLDMEKDSVLCSYYDGSVIECWIDRFGDFSYIEGKNLFAYDGIEDENLFIRYDNICSIEDGKFVVLYSGKYGEIAEDNIRYSEEGERLDDYYWNGERVSSGEEYWNLIDEVYDSSKECDPIYDADYDDGRYVGNGVCYYDEIIEVIEEY